MSDEDPLPDLEVIDAGPRYVLGGRQGSWGVWDRGSPGAPVATFPATDKGLDQAEQLYEKLKREDRRARGGWMKRLQILLFAALGLWIVARVTYGVLYVSLTADTHASWMTRAAQDAQAIDGVAFSLWIGSLVVLVVLWLHHNRAIVDRFSAPSTKS